MNRFAPLLMVMLLSFSAQAQFVNRWEPQNLTTIDRITELYVAILYRAPSRDGLNYWVGEVESGKMTVAQVAESFFDQPEVKERFPADLPAETVVGRVYVSALSRYADNEGQAYWVGELEAGRLTRPAFILAFLQSVYDAPYANPPSFDASLLTNRRIAAEFFAGVDSYGNVVNPGALDYPWAAAEADRNYFLRYAFVNITAVTEDPNTLRESFERTLRFQSLLGNE